MALVAVQFNGVVMASVTSTPSFDNDARVDLQMIDFDVLSSKNLYNPGWKGGYVFPQV